MSNLSEKKIIQNIDELIDNCNCYLEDEETDEESIKWFKMEKETLQDLLNLYKKKSRMVEIIAEHLTTDTHGKDWVIKYFEDEVELEDEQE